MTSEDIRADYVWRTMEAMGTIWSDDHCGHVTRQMADEIVRLREQLTYQTITLTAEHQRAERILALLREPSEAVMQAAVRDYSGDLRDAIRAAVAAAEQEVGA